MDFHAWLNSLVGFVSLAVAVYLASNRNLRTHVREIAMMAVKVDTMWAAFIASAVVKGADKGLLSVNSPVRLTPDSCAIMDSLREQLEAFRKTECPQCDERELALLIAERFKEELIKISSANGIQFEVAIVIATAIAKGEDTLTEILDKYVPKKPAL